MIINPYAFGAAAPAAVVDAADFNAATFIRSGAQTGATNSGTGILSFWVILDAAFGQQLTVARAAFGTEHAATSTAGTPPVWQFSLVDSTESALALNLTGAHLATLGTWTHVLLGWDLSTNTALLYINDVLDTSHSSTFGGFTSAKWTGTDKYTIGADNIGSSKLDGGLSEFYLAPGQYLDFSVTSNRRKFITAAGKPVGLGTDGSTPTGTKPLVFLHLDNGEAAANFATNRTGNGNFTVTGTLATRATSPSD